MILAYAGGRLVDGERVQRRAETGNRRDRLHASTGLREAWRRSVCVCVCVFVRVRVSYWNLNIEEKKCWTFEGTVINY